MTMPSPIPEPGPATADAVADLVRRIRPLAVEVGRRLDVSLLEGSGLTPATWAAVGLLATEGPQPVPAVARRWALGRQNVQRLVDRLVELRLAERVENPGHRRSALVALTPEGAARYRDLRDREAALMAALTVGLGRADVEACRRVLLHLQAGLRYMGAGRAAASPTGEEPS